MVPVDNIPINEEPVKTMPPDTSPTKPVFEKQKQIIETKPTTNPMSDCPIVQMKRVDGQTSVQLIDNQGLPEAYLDSANTGVMMFRQFEDYDILQITDESTGKTLCYIGGYALQFDFNLKELNSMEKIEQCMQGLTKLFKHKLMSQALKSKSNQ